MAEPCSQSKHTSEHSKESQPCTTFPTWNFFRSRTRISPDNAALAAYALEDYPGCAATKTCRTWLIWRGLGVLIPGHRKHYYRENRGRSQSNGSVHLTSSWEYSSTCSNPTHAAEHWRELQSLHVHILPGPRWFLFLLLPLTVHLHKLAYPEPMGQGKHPNRDQGSSFYWQ